MLYDVHSKLEEKKINIKQTREGNKKCMTHRSCFIPVFITFINKKNEITFPSATAIINIHPPPKATYVIQMIALKVENYVRPKM